MTTYADLFTGFGGATLGAMNAGLTPLWGIELDPAIAEVASTNLGHRVHVANILDCDPFDFDEVTVLHASPPCPSFSVANANGGETALDIALAGKVIAFVTTLKPRIFTLENVIAYRHSDSWRMIEAALMLAGYWLHVEHVNAADHGVPQTRKRMIVRAIRGGFVPYLPEPVSWVGWYAAVADLIDTLPESRFADWQLARLPELLQTVLVPQGGDERYNLFVRTKQEPTFTITANENMLGIRAFLVSNATIAGGDIAVREAHEPATTVTVQSDGRLRAFLMAGGGNTNFEEAYPGKGCRYADELAHTVTTVTEGGTMPKAWLVSGGNQTRQMTIREDDEPSHTVVAWSDKAPTRSLLSSGRVVSMTPRALARFQSFPDWYSLPDNARLAAKGLGNACPPQLMQRIYEGLIND